MTELYRAMISSTTRDMLVHRDKRRTRAFGRTSFPA